MKKYLIIVFFLFTLQFTFGQTRSKDTENRGLSDLEQTVRNPKIKEFSEYKIGDIVELSYYDAIDPRNQETKSLDGKCHATGTIENLNPKTLELKVKLENGCGPNGIVILRHDTPKKVDGGLQEVEKVRFEIMKEGETKWTSYNLWQVVEK